MDTKRIFSISIVIFLLAVALAACGGSPASSPATSVAPTQAATSPSAEPTVAAPTTAPASPQPAPATDAPVYGGTLNIGFPSDIATFDPPVEWGPQEHSAISLVYSGLYRWKYGTDQLEPELAADLPTISADGLTYTVPLRRDLKFSNGDPLTARDVKYTWDRMLDDATSGWAVSYYMSVKGAAEAFAGKADGVEGVKIIDDYTIEFQLAEPLAYFSKLLAMPWTYVMNRKHVEAVGADIARKPLGSGPYVLERYDPGVEAVFMKNPNYFRDDEPYAERIIVQLGVDPSVAPLKVARGEIDAYLERLPPLEFKQLQADPSFKGQAITEPWLNTFFVALNSIQEPLKDVRVRQAIAHALDREALIRAVPASMADPARTLVAPGDPLSYNASQPYYEHDVEKAKQLLTEAGYPDGFALDIVSANYYPWDKFAQVVQAQLAEVGIKLNLTLAESGAWHEWNSRPDNGIVFNHWPYEIPDPAYIFDGGFTKASMYPDSCCNWSWYATPEMEARLAAARTEQDPVKRGKLYQDIDKTVSYDEALWIPLWHPMEWYVTSANLGGFKPPVVIHPRLVEPQHYWSKSGK